MRKFLCSIGWHKWIEIKREQSQNASAEILCMVFLWWVPRDYKCKYCGKVK